MTVITPHMKHLLQTLSLTIALLASTTCVESTPALQGIATIADGDTIDIHGARISLDAIDAPESLQLCLSAAAMQSRCGQHSAFALADMISRSTVLCEPKGMTAIAAS
jgi:endonuclease YncB( thermonuclease family)